MNEPVTETSFHPELQHGIGSPWVRPRVGGIEGGFPDVAQAREFIGILRENDADYYRGTNWRVIKVTRQEVPADV